MADQGTVELLISAAVVAAGAGLWVRGRFRKRAALNWPVTEGTVLSTTVKFQGGADPGGSRYVAHIRYTYVIQGESFQGDFRRAFLRRDSADRWAGGFPGGRQIVVRYKPAKPRDSMVLEEEQSATAVV